jgi:lysyl-tRNA synthetase, class I
MTTDSRLPRLELSPELIEAAAEAKAWPFEEARKIIRRCETKGYPETVIFETGYGPSGLPHIGTFGEVARTSMVRHAFRVLTKGEVATKLLCFSDDMDGLRKVPDNVPNKEMLRGHLGKPLTRIPDPFDQYESFGHHNNAMLRRFLDAFEFDYEFASSTEYYRSGRFDGTLLKVLERFDRIMEIMLPSLREERAQSYAPFLPIHPETGAVMQVSIEDRDIGNGTITWRDPDTGLRYVTPVTGGYAKLQWKPDWAMRWAALGIDYEMSGKDLIDSVKLAAQICQALDAPPPEGFNYELFLDEKGQKISKSKGNGLTIDEWLAYAPTESLGLYMFQKPKTAKRLYFDVIPRAVEDYFTFLEAYPKQDWKNRLNNPVWHQHYGQPPLVDMPVPFSMLLNLVSASNAENKDVLWGFISRYAQGVTPQTHPKLDELTDYAIRYFDNFVKPNKHFRAPDETEREALEALDEKLAALPAHASAEEIQNAALDAARPIERYQDNEKRGPDGGPGVSVSFFQMLYQVLLGQERGPRFGSFAALYGLGETRVMIRKALEGRLSEHQGF